MEKLVLFGRSLENVQFVDDDHEYCGYQLYIEERKLLNIATEQIS